MKLSKSLKSVCGRNGNIKRLKTLVQAKAVLDAGWAERFTDGTWGIVEIDVFRDTTEAEENLLNKVNKS